MKKLSLLTPELEHFKKAAKHSDLVSTASEMLDIICSPTESLKKKSMSLRVLLESTIQPTVKDYLAKELENGKTKQALQLLVPLTKAQLMQDKELYPIRTLIISLH